MYSNKYGLIFKNFTGGHETFPVPRPMYAPERYGTLNLRLPDSETLITL